MHVAQNQLFIGWMISLPNGSPELLWGVQPTFYNYLLPSKYTVASIELTHTIDCVNLYEYSAQYSILCAFILKL